MIYNWTEVCRAARHKFGARYMCCRLVPDPLNDGRFYIWVRVRSDGTDALYHDVEFHEEDILEHSLATV